jgi:hypothetical protein
VLGVIRASGAVDQARADDVDDEVTLRDRRARDSRSAAVPAGEGEARDGSHRADGLSKPEKAPGRTADKPRSDHERVDASSTDHGDWWGEIGSR